MGVLPSLRVLDEFGAGFRFWPGRAWEDDAAVADGAVDRVLVLGDIHNGAEVFAAALRAAAEAGCDALVQVGDFWLQDAAWAGWDPQARCFETLWGELMWRAVEAPIPVIVMGVITLSDNPRAIRQRPGLGVDNHSNQQHPCRNARFGRVRTTTDRPARTLRFRALRVGMFGHAATLARVSTPTRHLPSPRRRLGGSATRRGLWGGVLRMACMMFSGVSGIGSGIFRRRVR